MFIEVQDDILGAQNAEIVGIRDPLRLVAQSHYEGKHYVSASRAVLTFLEKNDCLDEYTRTAFRIAARKIHDAVQVRAISKARLDLFLQLNPSRRRHQEFSGTMVYNRKIDEIKDGAYLQGFLLGEHQRDADFYVLAAKAYLAHLTAEGSGGVKFFLSPIGGGGDSMWETFERLAETTITTALADSDQERENGKKGTTASKLVAAHGRILGDPKVCGVSGVHVLKARELENILPKKLVIDALPDGVQGNTLTSYINASNVGYLGAGDYRDLKKVVGENILRFVVDYAKTLPPHKLARYLFGDAVLKSKWVEIGEFLFGWGCTPGWSRAA